MTHKQILLPPNQDIQNRVVTPDENGLVIIKRAGFPVGPNLISNGTFDDGTDWILSGAGVTIGGGVLNFVAAVGKCDQTPIAVFEGLDYVIRADYVFTSGAGLLIQLANDVFGPFIVSGPIEINFTLSAFAGDAIFTVNSQASATSTIDNIRLRQRRI